MTLSFSTTWPDRMGDLAGEPNYFTNKIAKGIWRSYGKEFSEFIKNRNKEENQRFDRINPFEKLSVYQSEQLSPKLHTIRRDTHNRWKAGNDIHFVINNRTKNRFQFAPVVKCVSVQEICITYYNSESDYPAVKIGKNVFHVFQKHGAKVIEQLAQNDGFPSVEAFFAYFNENFRGKLIHWTDLRY